MSEIVVKAARTFRVALTLTVLGFAFAGTVMALDPAGCGGEIADAGMSHHVVHAGGSQCFATYAPAAGILMLEVNVPAWSSVEPRIELRGAAEFTYLDRSPTSALVAEAPAHRQGLAVQRFRLVVAQAEEHSGEIVDRFGNLRMVFRIDLPQDPEGLLPWGSRLGVVPQVDEHFARQGPLGRVRRSSVEPQ